VRTTAWSLGSVEAHSYPHSNAHRKLLFPEDLYTPLPTHPSAWCGMANQHWWFQFAERKATGKRLEGVKAGRLAGTFSFIPQSVHIKKFSLPFQWPTSSVPAAVNWRHVTEALVFLTFPIKSNECYWSCWKEEATYVRMCNGVADSKIIILNHNYMTSS
jgi:hypothetical protein